MKVHGIVADADEEIQYDGTRIITDRDNDVCGVNPSGSFRIVVSTIKTTT